MQYLPPAGLVVDGWMKVFLESEKLELEEEVVSEIYCATVSMHASLSVLYKTTSIMCPLTHHY